MTSKKLRKVSHFINKIGLQAEFVPDFGAFRAKLNFKPFLDDIVIKKGIIYYHDKTTVSALLHEAGHLAVLPPAYRPLVNGSLSKTLKQMYEEIDCLQAENEKYMYNDDMCATAWAWAAGKHLNIPEHLIILDEEYDKGGAGVREGLRYGSYMGIKQLQYAGFCAFDQYSQKFFCPHLPVYPMLGKWLQD